MAVMRFARTDRFKKAWVQLNEDEKVSFRKAIKNLAEDIRYPTLRVKKIKGTEKLWEARASLSLRMTFQIEEDKILLRNIGHHDKTLERP